VETTAIHEHEEQADGASIGAFLASGAALACFFVDRKRPQWRGALVGVTLLFTLMAMAGMARASHSGGMIRHQEERPGFDPNAPPKPPAEVDL
jgi:hypothetical protein